MVKDEIEKVGYYAQLAIDDQISLEKSFGQETNVGQFLPVYGDGDERQTSMYSLFLLNKRAD